MRVLASLHMAEATNMHMQPGMTIPRIRQLLSSPAAISFSETWLFGVGNTQQTHAAAFWCFGSSHTCLQQLQFSASVAAHQPEALA